MIPQSASNEGTCNTQAQTVDKSHILTQGIDYLRVKLPIAYAEVESIEQRLGYIDTRRVNYYGDYFLDLTGDMWELVRTVESVESVLDFLKPYHWSRIDACFDVIGLHIESLPQPGTVIMNGGQVETIYSHHLKKRGRYAVFARAYDAMKAGHDLPRGTIRFEVEFKLNLPDRIRRSYKPLAVLFYLATLHIERIYGVTLPTTEGIELAQPSSKIAHGRERFYARYGKGILADVLDMGLDRWADFVVQASNRRQE